MGEKGEEALAAPPRVKILASSSKSVLFSSALQYIPLQCFRKKGLRGLSNREKVFRRNGGKKKRELSGGKEASKRYKVEIERWQSGPSLEIWESEEKR